MSQTETTQAVGGDAETSIFRIRSFQLMFFTRLASMMSNQMLAVVVGWQIYELTESAFALGLIGLVQLVPALCLALFSGEVSDRYDRRLVLRWVYIVQTIVVVGFLLVSLMDQPHVGLLYALLFLNAVSRTFESPALQSLLPSLVPPNLLSRAIAAYASSARSASLLGPSIGGWIYAFGVATDYVCCLVLISIAATASFMLPRQKQAPAARKTKMTWQTMSAGVALIWSNSLLFSVVALDLLATIFGGVTALLPIFARDILEIGPVGLGILRSSPAAGALVMALVLSQVPVTRSCGWVILGGAAVYGASSIVFGISTNTVLSIAMLLLFGAGDAISAVNRKTLMQTTTPNELLGRVSAVSTFSNTMGNQLGQLESGFTAWLFGTVGSVLFGGISVLVIVTVWTWRYPQLRRLERPDVVPAFASRPAA